MLIQDVAKLSPTERFLYWIKERHLIYLKRKAGKSKPWTNDEVLQSFFFTNPYRENDKTTVWFRENVREPLSRSAKVLFATVCFRRFGRISTGEALIDAKLLTDWRPQKAAKVIGRLDKVFTGAFMICQSPKQVCESLTETWNDRLQLLGRLRQGRSLQTACQELLRYCGLGRFMAYEIACDLRYTSVLRDAVDKLTWCNQGPGSIRGLRRLQNLVPNGPAPSTWVTDLPELLAVARLRLPEMPPFELREIEHSLCEWDKYERARCDEGRMKRKYNGQ